MTIRDVERFKSVIPKKIDEILSQIGKSDIVEINVEVRWNVYHNPTITTTTKSVHTEEIEVNEVTND